MRIWVGNYLEECFEAMRVCHTKKADCGKRIRMADEYGDTSILLYFTAKPMLCH